MELNNNNITQAINDIKLSLQNNTNKGAYFVVPPIMYTNEIDRSKYKGKGRPKRTDYVSFSPADEIRKLWT